MKPNPSRLVLARKRAEISKKSMADKIGVAPHTISRWENGTSYPSDENWLLIEKELGFSKNFYFNDDVEVPTEASFRSLTSMSATKRDAALSAGAVGYLLCDWVEGKFNLPESKVPDLSECTPQKAAITLRNIWGLGEVPIGNIIHLFESKGIRVLSLVQNAMEVDAYSIWRENTPYVFLNTFKSAERSRFDAAHELGHLVLHQWRKPSGRSAEIEANTFASSFLMPEADFKAELPYVHSFSQLLISKKRWRVSLVACAYRAHKLGLISDWKYRDFSIEFAKRGWNKSEPEPIERETSLLWKRVLDLMWTERMTISDIANDLSVPEKDISDLIFGVSVSGVPASSSPLKAIK